MAPKKSRKESQKKINSNSSVSFARVSGPMDKYLKKDKRKSQHCHQESPVQKRDVIVNPVQGIAKIDAPRDAVAAVQKREDPVQGIAKIDAPDALAAVQDREDAPAAVAAVQRSKTDTPTSAPRSKTRTMMNSWGFRPPPFNSDSDESVNPWEYVPLLQTAKNTKSPMESKPGPSEKRQLSASKRNKLSTMPGKHKPPVVTGGAPKNKTVTKGIGKKISPANKQVAHAVKRQDIAGTTHRAHSEIAKALNAVLEASHTVAKTIENANKASAEVVEASKVLAENNKTATEASAEVVKANKVLAETNKAATKASAEVVKTNKILKMAITKLNDMLV